MVTVLKQTPLLSQGAATKCIGILVADVDEDLVVASRVFTESKSVRKLFHGAIVAGSANHTIGEDVVRRFRQQALEVRVNGLAAGHLVAQLLLQLLLRGSSGALSSGAERLHSDVVAVLLDARRTHHYGLHLDVIGKRLLGGSGDREHVPAGVVPDKLGHAHVLDRHVTVTQHGLHRDVGGEIVVQRVEGSVSLLGNIKVLNPSQGEKVCQTEVHVGVSHVAINAVRPFGAHLVVCRRKGVGMDVGWKVLHNRSGISRFRKDDQILVHHVVMHLLDRFHK